VRDSGISGQERERSAPLIGSLGYALAALAGGYGLGFALWAWAHQDLLPGLMLANDIPAAGRVSLFCALALGMLAALAAWAAAGLIAWRGQRNVPAVLARSGTVLALFTLLAWLPVLALPGIQVNQPFLTLGLVASLATLAFLCVNHARHLWQPSVEAATLAMGNAAAQSGMPTEAGSTSDNLAHLSGQVETRPKGHRQSIPAGWALALVLALTMGYVLFMSALTLARHNVFMTHAFDLGIHDQVVYNALHLGYLRSTQHGAEAINYLREHFAPILYLIVPVYALRPEAGTLLILQSLLLGLGALPVYLLARRKTGSLALSVALAATYLLYPALHGINTFDFHQVVPATALLLFSLYFLETDRPIPFLVTLGVALLAKEEVALTAAAIGVYAFWIKRRYRLGAIVVVASLLYFVTVVKFVMPALGGAAQVNRFEGLMAPGRPGFGGVFITLFTNPWYVVQFILANPAKLLYLGQLFLPVCLLPLLAGGAWIVVVPPLAMALLSSAETQYTIGYHYPATLVPGVFFLAILGATRLNAQRYRRPAMAVAVLIAGLAMNYEYGWVLGKNFTGFPQLSPHQAAVTALLRRVPPGASVSSLSDMVPHVSNRENVYLFPIVSDADYLAVDSDPTANFWPYIGPTNRSDAQQAIAPYLLSGQYGVVANEDGALLMQRGAPAVHNQEGLQTLFGGRYEAENQPGDYGRHNQADPSASGGMARVGRPDLPHDPGKNGLVYGPYAPLLPGKYRVIFWLKLTGAPATGKIATLDVFSSAAGGPLAGTDVPAADFKPGDQYQPFVVDLETDRTWSDLEYRVNYAGKGQLWVDYIQIEPLRVMLLGENKVLDFPQNDSR
jgi:uncharacterized membrane protein